MVQIAAVRPIRRRLATVVTAATLLVASSFGTASVAGAVQPATVVKRAGVQTVPAIVSSGIAFQHQATVDGPRDIYLTTLGSVVSTIASGAGNQQSPSGYDDLVAFVDEGNQPISGDSVAPSSIVVVDLASGKRLTVTSGSSAKGLPSVYGRYVAWQQSVPGDGKDVMVLDLDNDSDGIADFIETNGPSPSVPRTLAGGPGDQEAPCVGDRGAVWVDTSTGASRITFHAWGSSLDHVVGPNAGYSRPTPRIGGALIVWKQSGVDGSSDIAVHNLDDSTTTHMTGSAGVPDESPATDGTRVTWCSWVGGVLPQTYVAKLGESALRVDPTDTWQRTPEVKGDLVAWVDLRYDDGDIALAHLDLKEPINVSTPKAPVTMYRSRPSTIYGWLRPRHTAGTYPVRIYKWRYVSGKWRSYGYTSAKASDYSSYTKYASSIRLPYPGKWRVRAYAPADSRHAAMWSSGYDYVTVK